MEQPRILLVEDEFIVALELKSIIEGMGYAVCAVVSSGEAAVECAGRERPDCVLMDVSLKGKIDGIEAARRIKAGLGIQTAFMSGYPADEVMERAGDVDPFGCFVKPLDHHKLQAALERFFSQSAEEVE